MLNFGVASCKSYHMDGEKSFNTSAHKQPLDEKEEEKEIEMEEEELKNHMKRNMNLNVVVHSDFGLDLDNSFKNVDVS